MNIRALALLAVAAVIGVGLYLLAMDGGARGTSETSVSDAAGRRDEPIPLQTVGNGLGPRAVSGLLSGRWNVVVRGPDGELLDHAAISIRRGGVAHTVQGATTAFEGLEPGTWTLRVIAEGWPDWHSDESLAPGRDVLTNVTMTNAVQLSGTVLDDRGEPVARVPIWMLTMGVEHPVRQVGVHGPPRAVTTHEGRFELTADAGGTFRLSLGAPGAQPRHVSDAFELLGGRMRTAQWTVPSLVRLAVVANGLEGGEVIHVDVLLDPRPTAPLVPTSGQQDGTPGGGTQPPVASSRAVRTETSSDENGESSDGETVAGPGARPMSTADARHIAAERAGHAAARKTDGQVIRRIRVESDREVVSEGLPAGATLRFLVQRGAETFAVPAVFLARPGADARLTLDPPSPRPMDAPRSATRRSCAGSLEMLGVSRPKSPCGLTIL